MPVRSLPVMLRDTVKRYPERRAMVFHGAKGVEELSYAALMEAVRAYAGAMSTLGLKRGDRVCIQSENCVEWALTDWGCQCLGLVVVPIYPTLPADQSRYVLSDSGAKVVVAGDEDQTAKSE